MEIFKDLEDFVIGEVDLHENYASIKRSKKIFFSNAEKQNLVLRHKVNIDFSMGISIRSNPPCLEFIQKDPALDNYENNKRLKISTKSVKWNVIIPHVSQNMDSKEFLHSSIVQNSNLVDSAIPAAKVIEFMITRIKSEKYDDSEIEIEINYFTRDAKWLLEYTYSFLKSNNVDIRVLAKIWQQTGEIWKNTKINFMKSNEIFHTQVSDLNSTSQFEMMQLKWVTLTTQYFLLCSSKNTDAQVYALIEDPDGFPAGEGKIIFNLNDAHKFNFPEWKGSFQVYVGTYKGLRFSKSITDEGISKKLQKDGLVVVNCNLSYWLSKRDGYSFKMVVFECFAPTTKVEVLSECISPNTTSSSVLPYYELCFKNLDMSFVYQGTVITAQKGTGPCKLQANFTWVLTLIN